MAAVTEEQVLEALKGVSDPDQGADIVSLGMVSGLVVKDGNVGFSIEVDPERGPQLEPLRKAAEAAVDNLSGVLSVTAVLTAEREAPSLGGGAGGDQGQQPDPATTGPVPTSVSRVDVLADARVVLSALSQTQSLSSP